ncbi:hypothetical protein [Natronomonas sp. EA1]|uniref:hypothetical protein n=1 Tax=Natronomonas sp. EA1 TaxID=3421655 RepID=UPI003EB93219
MTWACADCDRTYHEPPSGNCPACDGPVIPAGTDSGASPLDRLLARARANLLGQSDHPLADDSPRIRLLFRVLLALVFLLVGYAFGELLLALV